MSGKNLLQKRIFVVALLLLFMMMSSSVLAEEVGGAGTPTDPLRKDQGIIGVTGQCVLYVWDEFIVETGVQSKMQGVWRRYEDLVFRRIEVEGDGSEQVPFHIVGSTSGLFCRAPANIATNFKFMYKDSQTGVWQDTPPDTTQRQDSIAAVGTLAPPTALTTPTAAGITLVSIVEEAANCPRCKEIDNVWIKIRATLRLAGDAGSKIWHKGWKRYDEVYPTPGAMGAATGIAVEGLCFPIERASFVKNLNNWGDVRDAGNRCHAGIDLLTNSPGRVVAVAEGVVRKISGHFTRCSNEGLGEGGDTTYVLVYHPSLGKTINYGEINHGEQEVAVGQEVSAGQYLGPATNCGMLHFELYDGDVRDNEPWPVPPGASSIGNNKCAREFQHTRPSSLLDPTDLVGRLRFCEEGAVVSIGPNAYDAFILEASRAHSVEPAFIKAIIEHESGFDSREISITGCVGLMQICQNSIRREYITQTPGACCTRQAEETEFRPCDNEQQRCDSNLWCAAGGYLCSPDNDERFDPRLNMLSGTATLKGKIDAVGNCGADRVKAWIAAYNIGQNPLARAVNENGGCERWEEVWQVLQRNTDVSANTIYGVQKKYDVGRRLDNLRGTPEDYVGKVYQSYLEYGQQLVG